jgi:PAS domain S-box-containing protein
VLSSLYGGFGPIFSIVLSTLGFDYFFLPPRFHFTVEPSSYLRFAAFLGANILIAGLIEAKRRESKRAEAALKKSESYLAEAQKLSRIGSFGWNTSTGELFWTQETFRIFGLDPAIAPSLDVVFERIHPEDRPAVKDTLDRVSCLGGDLDFEHRLLLPDGSVKHLHVLGRAVRGESGVVEYIGATMDITSGKQAEEQLRRSKAYLVEAEKLSRAGSWAWDVNRQETRYWSDEMYRVFNRDPAQGVLSAVEIGRLHDPEEQARLMKAAETTARDKTILDHNSRFTFPDGSHKHIHFVGHRWENASGQVVELFGIAMDVTEQYEANVALENAFAEIRKSEARLRLIIDTIPALAWSTRPDGSVDFFNQRWLDYTGLSSEEGLDWGWKRVVHPGDADHLTDYWRSVVASGEPGEFEARLRRFDGEYRWFLFRFSPLRDESRNIVKWYGTNSDIEDRKHATEALRRSERNFRLIVDSIPALVSTMTASGDAELVNRQVMDYTGKTIEETARRQAIGGVLAIVWMYRGQPILQSKPGIPTMSRSVSSVDSIPGLLCTNTSAGEVELVNQTLLDYTGKRLEELINCRVAHYLYGKVVQLLHSFRARIQIDIVFELIDLDSSRRQHQILQGQSVDHIRCRETFRLQQPLVEIDHNLSLLAAVRIGNRGARYGHELRPEEIQTDIVEVLFGKARESQLQNRNRRGAEVQDQGRLRAFRHLSQDLLRDRGHLRGRSVETGVRLQVDLHERLPVHRHGLDVLDVVHQRGKHALVHSGDAAFHFLGVEARILPGDGDDDDGNVDVWEDVGRRPQDNHRSEYQNEERDDDESVRAAECDSDDPHIPANSKCMSLARCRVQSNKAS